MINKDQVKGAAKDIAGKIQEETGKLVGSTKQQIKGLKHQAEGKVQKGVGDLKEAVSDLKEAAKKGSARRARQRETAGWWLALRASHKGVCVCPGFRCNVSR